MTAACPPRLIRAASRAASPAKLVSASAASTIVRCLAGLVRAAATSLRKVGPTPAPGPSAMARRRSSASRASNSRAFAKGATITAVRWAELTATASGGLATLTMPAPARKAARAASRAAPVWWPEPDRMSAAPRAYLWLPAVGRGSGPAPTGRRIDEGFRRDGGERGFGNANVGEPDRAGERASGLEEMAGLEPKEGHARARFDRGAANPAGFPVDSGGNVDREHMAPRALERVD